MNNKYYVKCKAYVTPGSPWEMFYDQVVIDTSIQKSKIYSSDISWSIRIKVKGDNIETMYNMILYNWKVMQIGYDILNLSPIIQNINEYPRK